MVLSLPRERLRPCPGVVLAETTECTRGRMSAQPPSFRGAAIFLVAFALLLAAAVAPEAETVEPHPVLRLGIDAADLGTGDPHRAASRNDRIVADMIFNGLLRYRPGEAPVIEPDIALAVPEPELRNGKQVWRFKLRRDVFCHAGPNTEAYQLTADDVVFSLRRAADPGVSAYAGEYVGMSAERIDDFTVDVSLDTPISSILFFPKVADYAGGFIVCKRAVEALGDHGFAANPVGTGPFRFARREAGTKLVLEANDEYFRGKPQLGGIEIHYIPDFETRDGLLRDGVLDVMFGSEQADWFERMREEAEVTVDVFGVGQVATLHFNTARPPFDDPRVRKAVALAIDRDAFRSKFADGVVENVYSPVPAAFLPGGLDQAEVRRLGLDYSRDLDRARALLAEAGLPDGFDLRLVSSERAHYVENYRSLQEQLAPLGIRIQLEVTPHREMHRRIRADENAIVIYVAWRPNADVFLSRFFHSSSTVVTGTSPDTNFSHYGEIDRLIEAARAARDPGVQVRFWKQAQIKLLSDAVAYPLHYINLVYARSKRVDYGHPLVATMALYPQFDETTRLMK